jgi:hypothetical protein
MLKLSSTPCPLPTGFLTTTDMVTSALDSKGLDRKPIMEDMPEEEKQDLMGITSSKRVPVVESGQLQWDGDFLFERPKR